MLIECLYWCLSNNISFTLNTLLPYDTVIKVWNVVEKLLKGVTKGEHLTLDLSYIIITLWYPWVIHYFYHSGIGNLWVHISTGWGCGHCGPKSDLLSDYYQITQEISGSDSRETGDIVPTPVRCMSLPTPPGILIPAIVLPPAVMYLHTAYGSCCLPRGYMSLNCPAISRRPPLKHSVGYCAEWLW